MIPNIKPVPERRKNLIWLASYPKSGSTWLRLFIHAYLTGGTVGINDVFAVSDTAGALYEKVSPIPVDELKTTECFHLRTAALFRLAHDEEDRIVKTHCCNGVVHGVELIPQAFTRAAIYIVRDPRDIAVSYSDHLGKPIDDVIEMMNSPVTMSGTKLSQYLSSWSEHVESWTRKLPYPVLAYRYEDLISRPYECFAGLARFLTGSVDEEKLVKSINSVSLNNLRKQEDEHGFVERSVHQERFFRKGGSHWREVLSEKQARKIEEDHGPVMRSVYG